MDNIGVNEERETSPYLAFWGQKMRYRAKTHPLFWRYSIDFNRLAWSDPHLYISHLSSHLKASRGVPKSASIPFAMNLYTLCLKVGLSKWLIW
jgi:hypothetical protein